MPEPADSNLIRELLRAGEVNAAFRYMYKKYFALLCKISVPITGDEDESKDIIQNVFFSVWKLRDTLSRTETTPFKYYLVRSVINASNGYRKKQKRTAELLQDYEKDSSGIDSQPDRILEMKALEGAIQDGISRLSRRRRECFLLSRQSGLSYKQIAQQLNITQKAVELNISGALQHLRGYIQKYLEDEGIA
jgi:RNA polymerase sigma-70 factor (ECF subfamily)